MVHCELILKTFAKLKDKGDMRVTMCNPTSTRPKFLIIFRSINMDLNLQQKNLIQAFK